MKRFSLLMAMLAAIAAAGCSKCGPSGPVAPVPSRTAFKKGKCFGKAGAISCASDGNCGGTAFATCQEGVCCSGTLDPNDCSCHCAGGRECRPGMLCCPGACNEAPDLGVLTCRPQHHCFPCGPL